MFLIHVVESSSIADHCRTHALSESTDPDFQACCQLQEVLTTLESECSHALCNDEDKEDMLNTIKQAKK